MPSLKASRRSKRMSISLERGDSARTISKNMAKISRIKSKLPIRQLVTCLCLPRSFTKYERMTRRAHIEIDKNLDLRKLIARLRVASMTSLGLLSKD